MRDELFERIRKGSNDNEVAEALELTPEEVVLAQEASRALHPYMKRCMKKKKNDGDPITILDQIADQSETKWFDKIALKEAIRELDERERLIVYYAIIKTKLNQK